MSTQGKKLNPKHKQLTKSGSGFVYNFQPFPLYSDKQNFDSTYNLVSDSTNDIANLKKLRKNIKAADNLANAIDIYKKFFIKKGIPADILDQGLANVSNSGRDDYNKNLSQRWDIETTREVLKIRKEKEQQATPTKPKGTKAIGSPSIQRKSTGKKREPIAAAAPAPAPVERVPAAAPVPEFMVIKNKKLPVRDLTKGEYGFVLGDKLYPMFKLDESPTPEYEWKFVSTRMLPQEEQLFRRMQRIDDESERLNLYIKFYRSNEYNIPVEVIQKALELTSSDAVDQAIDFLRSKGVSDGYNISTYEPDNDYKENFLAYIESVQIGNRADMDKYEKEKKQKLKQKQSDDEKYLQMSKTPEEIEAFFDKIDPQGTEESKAAAPDPIPAAAPTPAAFDPIASARLRSQNVGATSTPAEQPMQPGQQAPIPPPDQPEEMERIPQGFQTPEPGTAGRIPRAGPQAAPIPQAVPAAAATPLAVQEQIEGEALRLMEMQRGAENEDNEELMKDDVPDISKYGHILAVQNIFKRNNKDFTYFKKMVNGNTSLKPSEDKMKRKTATDIIIAEYSSLFPIDGIKSDYDYEECLEIATFKFVYVENVRFERKWKKGIDTLAKNATGSANIPTGTGAGAGQTIGSGIGGNSNLSQGIILNLQNMGLNVNQLLNQQTPGGIQPPIIPATGSANISTTTQQGGKDKNKNIRSKVQRLEEGSYIRPPTTIKPKNTKKSKKIKFKEVNFNIRKKTVPTKLLFTNLNHQAEQQNIEIEGNLPTFNFKKSNNKRFKF